VDSDDQHKELSTDEVFDILDSFASMNGAFVLFGGGEPFLRDDFLEILRYTKSKGLWTYIITNGSLITAQVAEQYARLTDSRHDKIQVSLDGSCAAIHDKQRGVKGAFDMTLKGIRNLTGNGIRPLINTVATQLNFSDIPEILDLAARENALTYRCLMLHKIGRGAKDKLYARLELNQEQNDWLYGFLDAKRDELMGLIGIASDNACVFPMSTAAIRVQIPPMPGAVPSSYSCAAGTTKLAISPEGGVVPCSYFYDFPGFYLASLRERSLKEIWEDDTLWRDFREPLEPEGKCRDCDYLYTCKTGCRIMSYVGCGSFGGPDIGCTYDPRETISVGDPSTGGPDREHV
jgi:radical SAM protein with 4Fe4S-binding SPASM domain